MKVTITSTKTDWEGMGYIGLTGDVSSFRGAGFGRTIDAFKDAYVTLTNNRHNRQCGGILRSMSTASTDAIEIDPCLLLDLAVDTGDSIDIYPLEPKSATQIRIGISKTELNEHEIIKICRTYLCRQPLCVTQKKPIYLFDGSQLRIEVLAVQPAELAIFSDSTEVIIDAKKTVVSVRGLNCVGGLDNEKRTIRERILLPIIQPDFFAIHGIRPPRGILLSGPPGCGKTMIAQALSNEINAHFEELRCSEVFHSLYGESEKAVKAVFEKAKTNTPAVILVDEIDAIGGARATTKGELERRLVTSLLTEMDGIRSIGNVIVVATTNTPDVLDPALRRPGRFDYEIHIGVPSRTERLDILHRQTERMTLSEDVDLDYIAKRTHGFVGADLMLLCREAAFASLTRDYSIDDFLNGVPEMTDKSHIAKVDFDDALTKVKPSALREFAVEVPTNLGWDDVGGLATIKDTMIQEIVRVLRDPESFEKVGITPVKGVLLYGPPGTGKTLIARVIANEAEANFISIRGPELLSKWFGESEQRIRKLFMKARESSPCIIFFDEIDAVSAARGKSTSDAGDRIVNQLLTEMDGFETSRNVCVIAATNRVELVDPALLRPGRFDYQIQAPLPDELGREEIFKIHLGNKPLDDDIDIKLLVTESSNFSGAHIAELCRRAALNAFRENNFNASKTKVKMKHLMEATKIVKTTILAVEKQPIGYGNKSLA